MSAVQSSCQTVTKPISFCKSPTPEEKKMLGILAGTPPERVAVVLKRWFEDKSPGIVIEPSDSALPSVLREFQAFRPFDAQ